MTAPLKLSTPWKNRVAFVHQVRAEAFFLLVHPSGELLLVSNAERGAVRWDVACIRWLVEREAYWMCKYSVHDAKFPLPGLDEKQLATLAFNTGITFISRENKHIETPMMLDSLMARSLLTWCIKHPKMTKANPTVSTYQNMMLEAGLSPLSDEEYTGF